MFVCLCPAWTVHYKRPRQKRSQRVLCVYLGYFPEGVRHQFCIHSSPLNTTSPPSSCSVPICSLHLTPTSPNHQIGILSSAYLAYIVMPVGLVHYLTFTLSISLLIQYNLTTPTQRWIMPRTHIHTQQQQQQQQQQQRQQRQQRQKSHNDPLTTRGAGSVLVGVVFGGGGALRAATGMLAVSESGEGVPTCPGWVQRAIGGVRRSGCLCT